MSLSINIGDQIPETFSAGQSGDRHGKELAPALEGAKSLSFVMYFCQ
jgi:hypothetical protein